MDRIDLYAPALFALLRLGFLRIRSAKESVALIAAARVARNDDATFGAPERPRTAADVAANEMARRMLAAPRKYKGPMRSAYWKGG